MISAVLEYKPNILLRRRFSLKIPTRWADITPEQLIAITGRGSIEISSESLHEFFGISKRLAGRLSEYQGYSLLKHLSFFEEISPYTGFIIPEIKKLPAPADRLKDVTFAAFIFGDSYFQDYLRSGKYTDLDNFIASFYHPGKFDDKNIEKYATDIKREKLVVRQAVALNYLLIREWLAQSYPYVFTKDNDTGKRKGSGWVAVFDAVVGDDLSNHDEYAELPLSMVLRYLNRKTKEYYKNGGKV